MPPRSAKQLAAAIAKVRENIREGKPVEDTLSRIHGELLALSRETRAQYEASCRRTHISGRDDRAAMDAIVRSVRR